MGWVLAIARNATVDMVRTSAIRVMGNTVADALEDAEEDGSGGLPEPEELADDPADVALAQVVMAAYDALPVQMHALLWERLVGASSWVEVAATHGTSANGARRRYQRVLLRLRRAVSKAVGELPADDHTLVATAIARRRAKAAQKDEAK
jgi:DNA-directed RNA polymerase specialized sigma24 family protein